MSGFHEVPDAEKGANRPGFHLRDCSVKRRRVSQIALQHLMTMWTGVSIEIIAKLDATARTFFPKHIPGQKHGKCRLQLEIAKSMLGRNLRTEAASQLLLAARRNRANRPTRIAGCDASCTLVLGQLSGYQRNRKTSWSQLSFWRRCDSRQTRRLPEGDTLIRLHLASQQLRGRRISALIPDPPAQQRHR